MGIGACVDQPDGPPHVTVSGSVDLSASGCGSSNQDYGVDWFQIALTHVDPGVGADVQTFTVECGARNDFTFRTVPQTYTLDVSAWGCVTPLLQTQDGTTVLGIDNLQGSVPTIALGDVEVDVEVPGIVVPTRPCGQ